MNEFDGKKFYGFSLHNDPELITTTRNFEFKYARPEHLERAILKVQHNVTEHDRHRKKDILNRLCKARKITAVSDVNTPYCRDADVETQVSRNDATGRVRNLSDIEINHLIGKVKSYGDLRKQNSTDTYAKAKDTTKTVNPPSALKGILRQRTYEFPSGGSLGNAYHCGARQSHMGDVCVGVDDNGDSDTFFSEPTSEDQVVYHPFDMPQESLFETHTMQMPHMRRELHSGLNKLPDVPEEDELLASKTVMPTIVEEFRQLEPRWVEICEVPAKATAQLSEIKMQIVNDGETLVHKESSPERTERLPTDVMYTMHSHELQLPLQINAPEMMLKNQPPTPPSLPSMTVPYQQSSYDDNASTYDVEDSDLEYEMMGRAEYTKLCGQRPKTIEELINESNNSEGLAQFIEVEPAIGSLNLSLLKNVSPIRYSDVTDDREEDKTAAGINQQMRVSINNRAIKSPSPSQVKKAAISPVREVKRKIIKARKKPVEEVKASPRKKLSAPGADFSPTTEKSTRTSGRKSRPTTPKQHKDRKSQNISSNELRAMKNIVLTKSIEDLKMEKMTIFAKMTSMQERIIETLDKLRISLSELYVPDSHHEKTKRQKNAFEFSVRFSRNFLYPLKGMIENLHIVSVEQLCSASSNEATQRVLNIFSLIHQSLQTYYKQLRYFLLDQVPQKLHTLIELAATTVNICLEKQIFDRNDAIIECLQDRCTKFLGFLEDMHEERFLTARDNYRKASFHKTASNYSLKMFMNDLNMYEPKLVPKNHYNLRRNPKQRRVSNPSAKNTNIKTKTKTKIHTTAPATPKTSHMVIIKPDGDQISTQINELTNSSGIIHSVTDISVPPAEPSMNSDKQPNLNKALVEALQTVTKEQMRQVLQPIMQTLGTVLEKKVSV
ncbi:PREDICTED: uncharacterized protein LOC108367452 [Rhagoletis zephyria]|uniref:uncharacterized protein LOC108367452 n=1 Tax=Rhagoletis zephyria TaxID=28612 RepID=UPI0008119DB0|nr:PREDICTED: uncharacterized protein LOC108367452 [Rhagoletis zephyria]